jgi:hypothetical protein
VDGEPVRYVSVFIGITDLWHKDEHIKHLALHDALAKLLSRTLLIERLDQKLYQFQVWTVQVGTAVNLNTVAAYFSL